MKGRKRWLLTDTQGWVIERWVDAADVQDDDGGRIPVRAAQERCSRLTHLWVDAGFRQEFVDWVREEIGWTVDVVTKVAGQQGFQVQPRRWVVERSLAWLGKQRRLAKDYEHLEESVEAWIDCTMIGLMAQRLAHLRN